jgi:hypothetical protein
MKIDPTSFEEAKRSAHSSKWLEAMKGEASFIIGIEIHRDRRKGY